VLDPTWSYWSHSSGETRLVISITEDMLTAVERAQHQVLLRHSWKAHRMPKNLVDALGRGVPGVAAQSIRALLRFDHSIEINEDIALRYRQLKKIDSIQAFLEHGPTMFVNPKMFLFVLASLATYSIREAYPPPVPRSEEAAQFVRLRFIYGKLGRACPQWHSRSISWHLGGQANHCPGPLVLTQYNKCPATAGTRETQVARTIVALK
jgi:hypothetical protein